jgi:pimeloyl-ACP methyl ester carboxylesterase
MIGTAALGAAGVVLLATALALGYRAARQARVARSLAISAPPYPSARTWLIKQRWSFDTDPELRAWGKKSLPMVLSAPHRSLRDVYLFNKAFTFYPQPLYQETMTWDASQHGTRFEIPFFLFHGASDQHTLTSLAVEYFAAVEAPVKSLALIPGGGHCAVLTQPDAILARLRAEVTPLAAAASQA